MAKLIKCAGCGAEISKKAKTCPHCGEPAPKETSLLTWLVLILFVLGIFGSMSPDSSSSSSSSSSVDKQEKIAQQQRAKEQKIQREKTKDTKYFAQSKEVIIKDINLKIQNKKYNDAIKITTKYPSFKGKDDSIDKIHTEVVALLAKEKKEKQAKHKKEILKKLKTIPSSEYTKNKQLYQTLAGYEPNNKKYKAKVKFYADKIKKKETEEAIKKALFGEQPRRSNWDGSYSEVERYLKRVARDPDSVEISNCTKVYQSDNGWLVACEWRGKNGFGGMSRDTNWFTIRQNRVIRMDKASAYSF